MFTVGYTGVLVPNGSGHCLISLCNQSSPSVAIVSHWLNSVLGSFEFEDLIYLYIFCENLKTQATTITDKFLSKMYAENLASDFSQKAESW